MKDFSELPPGYVVFCDDIREETSGKTTVVGIYHGVLLGSGFPLIMPKLCFQVAMRFPNDKSVENFEVQIYAPGDADENPSFKFPVPAKGSIPSDHSKGSEDNFLEILLAIPISPFVLNAPGRIKVRVKLGGKIFRMGSLLVEQILVPTSTAEQ